MKAFPLEYDTLLFKVLKRPKKSDHAYLICLHDQLLSDRSVLIPDKICLISKQIIFLL